MKKSVKDNLVIASRACLEHAKALLDSAKAVEVSGHHNIAYHLAALSLEEVGRIELLKMKQMAYKQGLEKDWLGNAEKSHVQKLLWCLLSLDMLSKELTPEGFQFLQGLSLEIHQKRLAGLYVGQSKDGLKVPSEQITAEDATNLIIPCLSIHDSFIVEVDKEDILREIMSEAYLKAKDTPDLSKCIPKIRKT